LDVVTGLGAERFLTFAYRQDQSSQFVLKMLFLRGVQPAVLASLIGVAASSSSDNTNTPDSCDNSAQAKNAIRLFNEKIKNVVVLAQENRSFDTLLEA
jgi:phospholipase C